MTRVDLLDVALDAGHCFVVALVLVSVVVVISIDRRQIRGRVTETDRQSEQEEERETRAGKKCVRVSEQSVRARVSE